MNNNKSKENDIKNRSSYYLNDMTNVKDLNFLILFNLMKNHLEIF